MVFSASPSAHLTQVRKAECPLCVLVAGVEGGGVQSRKCLPEIDLAHDLLFIADDIIK